MKSKFLGIFLLTAILLFTAGCGSPSDKNTLTNDEKLYEGWAGPPEDMEKKPFEYYYMRRINRASPKSVEKQDPVRMRETYIDGAALTAKADFMRKMIGESYSYNPIADTDWSPSKILVAEYNPKVKGIKTKDCRPLKKPQSEIPGIEWEECECSVYAKVPGGKEGIRARGEQL